MAKSAELLNKVNSRSEESKFREDIDFLTKNQLDILNYAEFYFCHAWAHQQFAETEYAKPYYAKTFEKKPILKDDMNLA